MKWRRGLSLGIVFSFVFFPGPSLVAEESLRLDDTVTVFFQDGKREFARSMAEAFELEKKRLCYMTGFHFKGPTRLYLCEDGASFRKKLQDPTADTQVAAVAFFKKNTVIVNLIRSRDHFKGNFNAVLAHEIFHLIFHAATEKWGAQGKPLWFNEGMACWAGGAPYMDQEIFQKAVDTDSLLDFKQLESYFPSHGRSMSLAYQQSHSFISFIQSRGKEDGLVNILKRYSAHGNFQKAFLEGSGNSFEEMEHLWRRSLRKSMLHWFSFFSYRNLFLFATLLLVLAYWVKKLKTKRIRRQWDAQDQDFPKIPDAW